MSATIRPAGCALDPAWHAERDRLDSLTSLDDARTLALCERRAQDDPQYRRDAQRAVQLHSAASHLARAMVTWCSRTHSRVGRCRRRTSSDWDE
jgi:hypothetical protein